MNPSSTIKYLIFNNNNDVKLISYKNKGIYLQISSIVLNVKYNLKL